MNKKLTGDKMLFITATHNDLQKAGEFLTSQDRINYVKTLLRKQYNDNIQVRVGIMLGEHTNYSILFIGDRDITYVYSFDVSLFDNFISLPFPSRESDRHLACELILIGENATKNKTFPMQNGPYITWEQAEHIFEKYSYLYGTDQSLERLAERGGFSWTEVQDIWAKYDQVAAAKSRQ